MSYTSTRQALPALHALIHQLRPLRLFGLLLTLLSLMTLSACDSHPDYEPGADTFGFTRPTPATIKANETQSALLPLGDKTDFENANRGLVARPESLVIKNSAGETIWSRPDYDFIHFKGPLGGAPGSVNPSLWRQAALNNIVGLFKVTDGIYQVRGFDLSNLTIIEGQTGWIIVDVLTASETAKAAIEFAQQKLGKKPIRAILFTHSHIDHFGGIEGVLSLLSSQERHDLQIVAPKGFMEEATSENIIAGTAMGRRAMYMYGKRLPRSGRGHVGSGLGKGPAFGSHGLVQPTRLIDHTQTRLKIDGVPFVFQYTPGSEAPAEFTFYLPTFKAFDGAEVVSHNMHNLYTLRGAKVRNALQWSDYIEEARQLFGDAEVYLGSHHWPIWGRDNIDVFLRQQRDTYKYIHDQSVRLMNQGFSPEEIAEKIHLPDVLNHVFSSRGYYGTIKHNAKAVYQSYMGWFNGNPAALDPLPQTQTAERTIAMMGGVQKVLKAAQSRFDAVTDAAPDEVNTEYRWLAQLLNMALFTEPDNVQVKSLLAKVYDQLGYMAESGPWRDFYLSAAFELRHGLPDKGISPVTMKNVLMHTEVDKFFDTMASSLDGAKAEGKNYAIEVNFTDLDQHYLLWLENAVLHHRQLDSASLANSRVKQQAINVDARLNLTHELFIDILLGNAGISDLVGSDQLSLDGSTLDLIPFFSLLDKPKGVFGVATP